MGVIVAACSKAENPGSEILQANIVTVTTTVGFYGNVEEHATKALDIDYVAKTLTKTFAVGDQVALTYRSGEVWVKAVSGPLTGNDITNGGKSAKLTFELVNPNENSELRFIYPASMVDESCNVDKSRLATQNGTLSEVAGKDLASSDTNLEGLALPADVTLRNDHAIISFTLKDASGAYDITGTITRMVVSDGTDTYDVTGHDTDGHIYVAIRPVSDATIHITATDGTKDYAKTLTGKKYDAGQFYQQGLKMAEVAPSVSLTNPDLGQVIGSDGKNYPAAATLPEGVTKAAVIVYLNGSNGLALALNDETSTMPWADANTVATNATPKFSNATWRLPTIQDWWNIFEKEGDIDPEHAISSSELAGYILGAGGSNFQAHQHYWLGTVSSGHNVLYVNEARADFVDVVFDIMDKDKDHLHVRLCLAF